MLKLLRGETSKVANQILPDGQPIIVKESDSYTIKVGDGTSKVSELLGLAASRLASDRNITIGNSTKSFNGTANVSFTLDEIGTMSTEDISQMSANIDSLINTAMVDSTNNFKGASSTAAGSSGTVPGPAAGDQLKFLRGDGKWVVPTNTTYSIATTSKHGLMSSTDKSNLEDLNVLKSNLGFDSIEDNTGLTINGMALRLNLKSSTPLTNDSANQTNIANRTYPISIDKSGYVAVNVPWSNTTYSAATTSANGLMTSAMVTKLNGIAAGAQVNTITGIKGNSETEYRTGQVNLTAANIGAATSTHTHNYAGSSSAGGSATSAVKLATARTINGVSFNGTANITVYDPCNKAPASKTISAKGWYRIAEVDYTTCGSFVLSLNRAFSNLNSESHTFTVNIAHQVVEITEIGRKVNFAGFTQIRVLIKANDKYYIEAYYDTTTSNICYVQCNNILACNVTPVAFTTISSIPSGYVTLKIWDISVPSNALFKEAEHTVYEGSTDMTSDSLGIHADGSIVPTTLNSVTFTSTAKRFRLYVRCPYGNAVSEYSIERETEGYTSTGAVAPKIIGGNNPLNYTGSISFFCYEPTTWGAAKIRQYIMWFRFVKKTGNQIMVQVVDSGWVGFGAAEELVSTAGEYEDDVISKSATTVTYNQRHNKGYSIYKIVEISD